MCIQTIYDSNWTDIFVQLYRTLESKLVLDHVTIDSAVLCHWDKFLSDCSIGFIYAMLPLFV